MKPRPMDCCTALISVGDSPALSERYDRMRQAQAAATGPEYAKRTAYALAVRQMASMTDAQLTLADVLHRLLERGFSREDLVRAYDL